MNAKCRDCKHFYITFDRATPYGCKAYQIQSAIQPSQVVKRANNGQDCIGFSQKAQKNQAKPKNLNDERYW